MKRFDNRLDDIDSKLILFRIIYIKIIKNHSNQIELLEVSFSYITNFIAVIVKYQTIKQFPFFLINIKQY